jgi:hypothetical protein
MLSKHKIVSGLTTLSLASTLFVTPAFAQTSPSPSATATTNPGRATIRFVHASPDAPAVDVYMDSTRLLSGIGYKAITRYLTVPAGRHTFKVFPTTAKGAGNPVVQSDVELNAGWDYSIAATGKLAQIQMKVFSDNLNLPSQGKSKIRVYHLSSNAPAVNIAQKGGETIVRGLAYPNATEYLEVDPKAYNLEVQNASDSKAVLDVPNVSFARNSVHSVFAMGLVGDTPALTVTTTVDRKATATPATGAEEHFGFMALVAGMIAATGLVFKKIALVQEQS